MDNLNYGIIGNCRSAALISKTGSIDWCCLPEFDSASVFAKILDESIGGSFEILVDESYNVTQSYIENTAILVTSFSNGKDAFDIYDFMPRYIKDGGGKCRPPEIIRYLKYRSGAPTFSIKFNPKLLYALGEMIMKMKKDFVVYFTNTSSKRFESIYLYSNFSHKHIVSQQEIQITNDGFFLMSYNEKISAPTIKTVYLEMERTKLYWLNWCAKTTVYKKYNAEIIRSAITLKLLFYEKTGAIVAAITTSLPETIGEVRNWDYRFCWIRDASMVIKVIADLGHRAMSKDYLRFIIDLIPNKDEKLQIMYGINKEKILTEQTLDHLSGYQNSKPVRIGNAAYVQRQNDIYGILMDVVYQQFVRFKSEVENEDEIWSITKSIVCVVENHWQERDKGIWEYRADEEHFTFSKVLCWTAVDRAIKIASILEKASKVHKWKVLRDTIKADVLANAWNDQKQAFTQFYGSNHLDAAVLLMENYGFIEAEDPKYISTVKAIGRELSNNGLLFRYKNVDDFGIPSSSFTICSFWYISSLCKIGEVEEAEALFEKLLSYSNHLGLFSEDIDFNSKRLLGNFPQGYSHLALIETAINISKIKRTGK